MPAPVPVRRPIRRPTLRCFRRLWPAAVLLLFTDASVAAQTRAITQYTLRQWDKAAGLPQNSVTSIAQTAEGYVWLATQGGLARFDGARFTSFGKFNTLAFRTSDIVVARPRSAGGLWIGTAGGGLVELANDGFKIVSREAGLPNGTILSLSDDGSGGVWIGTAEGLSRLQRGRVVTYAPAQGAPRAPVNALVPARAGGVWVGLETGEIFRFDGAAHRVPASAELRGKSVQSLLEDVDGTLWIGTREGLFRMRAGGVEPVFTAARSAAFVKALHRDRHGALWVGTRGDGVVRLQQGRVEQMGSAQGLPSDDVLSLAEDREGNLWVGTNGRGVAMLRAGSFVPLTPREGLSGAVVLPILEDRTGAIWLGTYGQGLNRIQGGKLRVFTERQGLASDFVLSLAEGPDGALWIGTRNGLSRLQNGRVSSYGASDGLPSAAVVALYTDPTGTVWVGTSAGVGRVQGRRILPLDVPPAERPNDYVHALLRDREGSLWIGTAGGLVRVRNGRAQTFSARDGLSSEFVLSLHEDPSGTLWIGTNAGLTRFRGGRFRALDAGPGALPEEVYRMLEDDDGNLWLSGSGGVSRVRLRHLNAVADGRMRAVPTLSFGTENGMPSTEANGGIQPAGWKDRRGRLWFPTIAGAAIIDPKLLRQRSASSPAFLERVLVDGKVLNEGSGGGSISVPAGAGRLEVEYTAINFHAPEAVSFQYRMEGFDTAWVDAGNRRSATYTNLPPGSYRFLMRARDRSRDWSRATVVDLAIGRHFHQTWPFQLAVGMLVIAAVFLADRVRTRRHAARERELVSLVEERERAERRYRELFENASDAVLILDPGGCIVSLNRRAERLLGRTEAEVRGVPLEQLAPDQHRPVLRGWSDARAPGPEEAAEAPVQELELLASDGRTVPVEASIRWIHEEGRPVAVQAIMRDMTDRHRLQHQLRQAQKMEAVGRLAGGVAHDFNNLLSVIGGNAELALSSLPPSSAVRGDLEEIRDASERAAGLTRQLLTFSRQQVLQPRALNLNSTVRHASKLLKRMIGEDVDMVLSLNAEPADVYADPGQMEQVLMNLAVNARDAMPRGGTLAIETATVTVGEQEAHGLDHPSEPGRYVVLSVRDTGVGMDQATRAHIFDPFYTTKDAGKGTGLGLSTVYGIVQQSGGHILVSSTPGTGSEFQIYLPQAAPAAPEPPEPDAAAAVPGAGTVLVVEDEPALRMLARRTLERSGYLVLEAGNGREALGVAKSYGANIDLVMTDVVMPQMGGPELIQNLAEIRPGLRVLYMSGYMDDALFRHGVQQGDLAFLQKPFSPNSLVAKVQEILRGR